MSPHPWVYSTSSTGHHLREKGICCSPITCKNWEKELTVMLFITHDVVKLSEIIIISARFDNSFDTETQVLFCFREIWNDKSTHCQFMVLPLYSDLFTYFYCQWAKLGNNCKGDPVNRGRLGYAGKQVRNAQCSLNMFITHPPLCTPTLPFSKGLLLPAKKSGKERSSSHSGSIPGLAPRCWQGTLV